MITTSFESCAAASGKLKCDFKVGMKQSAFFRVRPGFRVEQEHSVHSAWRVQTSHAMSSGIPEVASEHCDPRRADAGEAVHQ